MALQLNTEELELLLSKLSPHGDTKDIHAKILQEWEEHHDLDWVASQEET
jgi:hypothetical protein